jgi:hypothetical protein
VLVFWEITFHWTQQSFHFPLYSYAQVPPESANQFGELVADPVTKELLHYTEKPETFVCEDPMFNYF